MGQDFTSEGDTFIKDYDLNSNSKPLILLKVNYYMMTSLTTVGLGDYNPKSNIERIEIAFCLLFGVMFVSIIIGAML
jgi:hypothetical protein